MSTFFDSFKPRDYQAKIHTILRKRYDQNVFRFLLHLFTGAGKTTGIAAFIPKIFPDLMKEGPMLFLSHRREILFHAYSKFTQIYPDAWIGIEMGEYHATGLEDMIFISVDSLGKLESSRLKKYLHRKPSIIVGDEAHHAAEGNTWDRILTFFGVGSDMDHTYKFNEKPPLVIHMTATPNRSDGQTLGAFVDPNTKMATISLGIDYGIDNGWLVKPITYDLHMKNCDWLDLSTEERAAAIAKVKSQFAPSYQTLVFAGSVEESKIVAATLNKLGIGRRAGHVDGTTDKEKRDEIVSGFSPDGVYDTLTNRLVFTEGYDNAYIQAIIDAGRTQSDSLFEQKVGRGLRPWPGTVDGLDSVDERLQAIAESPKPVCHYFTMYDTSHLELSPAIDLRVMDEQDVVQMPTCNPIIDVILYDDPEEEEIPPRNWDDLDQIELFAVRKDIWTKTVFNEKLKVLTDLRWVIDNDKNDAALWIPKDPEGKTDTPVIWRLIETDKRKWQFQVVYVGGYSERRGKPLKAYYEDYPKEITDFAGTLQKMDKHLKSLNRKQYELTKRDAYKEVPAVKRELDYLKRVGISHGPKITRKTAHILMDSHRINTSITKLGLK